MIGVAFNAGDRRGLSPFFRSDFLALDPLRVLLPSLLLSPVWGPLTVSLRVVPDSASVDADSPACAGGDDAAPARGPAGGDAGAAFVGVAVGGWAVVAVGWPIVACFGDSSHAAPPAPATSVNTAMGSSSDRVRAGETWTEMPCPVARVIVPAPDCPLDSAAGTPERKAAARARAGPPDADGSSLAPSWLGASSVGSSASCSRMSLEGDLGIGCKLRDELRAGSRS